VVAINRNRMNSLNNNSKPGADTTNSTTDDAAAAQAFASILSKATEDINDGINDAIEKAAQNSPIVDQLKTLGARDDVIRVVSTLQASLRFAVVAGADTASQILGATPKDTYIAISLSELVIDRLCDAAESRCTPAHEVIHVMSSIQAALGAACEDIEQIARESDQAQQQ